MNIIDPFTILLLAGLVLNFIYIRNFWKLMRHMKAHHEDLAAKYCVDSLLGFSGWLSAARSQRGLTMEEMGKVFAFIRYLTGKKYASSRDPRLVTLCNRTRLSFLAAMAAFAALFVAFAMMFVETVPTQPAAGGDPNGL